MFKIESASVSHERLELIVWVFDSYEHEFNVDIVASLIFQTLLEIHFLTIFSYFFKNLLYIFLKSLFKGVNWFFIYYLSILGKLFKKKIASRMPRKLLKRLYIANMVLS